MREAIHPMDMQAACEMLGTEPHLLPAGTQFRLKIARAIMQMHGRQDMIPFETMLGICIETLVADPPPGLAPPAAVVKPPAVAGFGQSGEYVDYTRAREQGLLVPHEGGDHITPPPAPLPMTREQLQGLSPGTSVMFRDEVKGGLNSGLFQGVEGNFALVLTSHSSRPLAVPAGDIRVS